jgi:alpha/beta superfamily hydrolase
MEPFYFGPPPALRFGVYHPAAGGSADRAVLLCPALGHEYVRAHRALRNLAVQLSRSGVAVLRFDYLGVGDSAGEPLDGSVEQWVSDIDAAGDELRRRSGLARITVVGLRMGAGLAALACRNRTDVERLICWDPVLSGAQYLAELSQLQTAWLEDRLVAAGSDLDGHELLGMPLSDSLRRGIAGLDPATALAPGVAVEVVASGPRPDAAAWVAQLGARGIAARYHEVPSAGGWTSPEAVHQLLLPHEILRHVAALVSAP